MKNIIKKDLEKIYRRYKNKRRVIIAICVVVVGLLYLFKNVSFLMRALSTIGLLISFYLVDHLFEIDFEDRHYVFIVVIAFSSFLLSPLYFVHPQYDKAQHLVQPIMVCSMVYYMIRHLDIKEKWKLLAVFFIVMGFVGMHEIGEYWLDQYFDLKLQGVFLRDFHGLEKYDLLVNRLDDTMIDMSLGTLGAGVYAFVVYYYRKYQLKRAVRSLPDKK